MKKQLLVTLLVTVVVLAVGSLYAQTGEVRATIPFDFTAGNMSLPAGQYSVARMTDAGGILLITSSGSGKGFVHSLAAEKVQAPANTELVFHKYGDRYFLYQIWIAGENRGRELPKTRLEKELASNARPTLVAVLASR